MSERISKLYGYINETLDMMQKGYIGQEAGKKNIENIEPEIFDKIEIYEYIKYQEGYKFDYWNKFLFKTDEDKVSYLENMCHSKYGNKNLIEEFIKDFLKMPKKVRENFYKTNFVELEKLGKNDVDCVKMCGKQFILAEPNKIFHNLSTLYLLSSSLRTETDMQLFDKINNDIMKVLKIDRTEFLDTYGNAIIHALDISEIYNKWSSLEVNKRRDFQEAFVSRLVYRGHLNYDKFVSLVDNGHLPYDLNYPRSKKYLMSLSIKSKLDNVTSYLRSTPFNEEELKKKMDETTQFIINVKNKYDLYFYNPKMLEDHIKEITEDFNKYHRGKDKNTKSTIEANLLKYSFEIEDILKNREVKVEKKLKI
jgi:hypothetical protein